MSRPDKPDDQETERALQALLADPVAARQAVLILREELRTATGLERQALMSTIALLTGAPSGVD